MLTEKKDVFGINVFQMQRVVHQTEALKRHHHKPDAWVEIFKLERSNFQQEVLRTSFLVAEKSYRKV